MKHSQAQDFILMRMRQELSPNLHYHSINHTLEVMQMAKEIAQYEELNSDDIALLETAAAYHDCGFLRGYFDHEILSCELARKFLPKFGYEESSVLKVEEMIMATRVPQDPQTELARILCDADLEYLGGKEYDVISKTLYTELLANGFQLNAEKWLDTQIGFLEEHRYWTNFAQKYRLPGKQKTLYALIRKRDED